MKHTWNPPRGAVTVNLHPCGSSWVVDCAACGYHYPPEPYRATRTDADDHKRGHHCPDGTQAAWPTCPTCKATGKHCRGADAYEIPAGPYKSWHWDRWAIYCAATGLV